MVRCGTGGLATGNVPTLPGEALRDAFEVLPAVPALPGIRVHHAEAIRIAGDAIVLLVSAGISSSGGMPVDESGSVTNNVRHSDE